MVQSTISSRTGRDHPAIMVFYPYAIPAGIKKVKRYLQLRAGGWDSLLFQKIVNLCSQGRQMPYNGSSSAGGRGSLDLPGYRHFYFSYFIDY